jgi:ATP/ADP translocase
VARCFERFFNIHQQELGRVLLMAAYLLLVIASYSATKAVRDSLFVTKIGPSQLPYVYLLIAGAMGLVSLLYSKAVNRIGVYRLIRATSLVAISVLLMFWVVFRDNSTPWFYVLYVWVSLFGAITASQCWLLATHVFDPREARRVFSMIGIGGILGGVFGGALTNRMAHWFGTESLLIVCACMMAATLAILYRFRNAGDVGAAPTSPSSNSRALFRQVRESRQLTIMVVLMSIAVTVEAFIDYEYKVVAADWITSKDQLTAFFGSVTFYIGLFALLFQVFLTNRVLKRFGVGWAITLLPAALFFALMAVAIRPYLWTAALLQFIDGGFSYSIHRSGMELLYLPIPPQTRNAVKGFIDTFVDRAGRAAGAILLLLFTTGLALSVAALSLIAGVLVIVWITMAIAVKRQYLHSFRLGLAKKTIEAKALHQSHLESATMQSLLAMLTSADVRQVLYALDLLGNTHPNRWRAYVHGLVHHRSRAVRARTIALLARWNDAAITGDEFIHHPDCQTARIAFASGLRFHWNDVPDNRGLLKSLLWDPCPAVVRQAMLTAGAVRHKEFVPLLINRLGDRRLRRYARASLLKFGDAVIPDLVRRLSNKEEPPAIRRRIPKVLALTGKQQAANALMRQFHRLDYHLGYAVLKALNRMRVHFPQIVLDRNVVEAGIRLEHGEHSKLTVLRAWLDANRMNNDVFALFVRAVEERLEQRLERIFRLIGLIYSPHDIYSVYYNCRVKPASRPAAIEFLDNILDAEIKEWVLPLLEPSLDEDFKAGVEPVTDVGCSWFGRIPVPDDPWLQIVAKELERKMGGRTDEGSENRAIARR